MKIRKAGPIIGAIVVPALLFVLLLVLAGSAGADRPEAPSNSPPVPVPHLINYQGRLLDDTGVPVNGSVNLTFGIYTSLGAPVAIWQETHNGVSVSDGYFDVLLGETTPLGQNYFVGLDELYLEVKVGTEALSPRQRIASMPYAVVADTLVPGAEISGEGSGGTFGQAVLNIDNTAPSWDPSHALFVRSASGNAVHAESGATALSGSSTWIYGVHGESTNSYAGHFYSSESVGLYAETAGSDHYDYGAEIHSDMGYGLYVTSQNNNAIRAVGGTLSGVAQPGGVVGVFGGSRERTGVWGSSYNNYGVRGYSTNSHGVYGEGAVYGLYTPDSLYVGGSCTGCDIAEAWEMSSDVETADVVIIDSENGGLLIRSARPYDTAVAGIVSGEPALLVGQSNEETPLALAGRVPCKVSAENGNIAPGDLLTTSSTPGHAMKAEPVTIDGVEIYRPGTILGKALEPLEEGAGVIMVLVTLQ